MSTSTAVIVLTAVTNLVIGVGIYLYERKRAQQISCRIARLRNQSNSNRRQS